MESVDLVRTGNHSVCDAFEEFSQQEQVDDDGSCQERVLTHVVEHEGVLSSHEDGGEVLIHGLLGVSSEWNVLDHDLMIDLQILLSWVQDSVRFKDVIDATPFRNFLRSELSILIEILSVVVTEVVVADDRSALDTSTNEEIGNRRLDLCLACLEVITNHEQTLLLGEFNHTWYKGVLR